MKTRELWQIVDAERERLLALLAELDDTQWQTVSLSQQWTVRQVTAHLSAAGCTGVGSWLLNMALTGFNTDRHNDRLMAKHLGSSNQQTLANYEKSCTQSKAPLYSVPALLGEIVVHSQDIAVPLGKELEPSATALREVAKFFSTKDFAVNSKTLVSGLQVIATDDDFSAGTGAPIRGTLLDLVMVMAGRPCYLDQLDGEGVDQLRAKLR